MKIAVFGAGAIGGLLGARFAAAGHDVTLIARGDHLAAMRRDGLRLIDAEGERALPVRATDDPAAAGPQDAVVLTLKAHTAGAAAEAMRPLLAPGTAVVTAMNGLPYWYFHGLDGPWRDRRLESVDPGGRLWRTLGPERAVGCVVYAAADRPAPGVVRHVDSNRFILGEPDGTESARVSALADAFRRAGFDAPVSRRIRDDIWLKLLGNLSFNPISVLTHETLSGMATDPGTRAIARATIEEAMAVAERLGVTFEIDADARIEMARGIGPHKTSMLQDLEAGRSLEIDPIVAAVTEIAGWLGVRTPTLDMLLALVRQRARNVRPADRGS